MSNLTDAYLSLVRSDYRAYCYHVHDGRWIPGKSPSYICARVQEFVERPTTAPYEILILSVPPQHSKSMSVTETLPSWVLGKWPTKRIIEISYGEEFAMLFGRRNLFKLQRFGGEIFGVAVADSPCTATEFEMQNGIGGMISRGIMSGVTGRPGDLMIIDDPIKNRMEADSETYRNRIFAEWENSFRPRLAPGAKVIVIQTRWHEDDFAGRLIATEKNVEVINLPCEAEPGDLLGRPVGAALLPEIGKDDAWLRQFKAAYQGIEGSRAWNALYQGRPTSAEGNLIKREWWRYYTELPKMVETIMSVDATFKNNPGNDFVAIQVWGKRDANSYLIDALKRRLDFPGTVKAILAMRKKHPEVSVTLVEDKANGSAIIQVLRDKIPGILPVEPEGGKIARANAVSGYIETGNVYLPKNEDFTGNFVDECAAFPNGQNDDQVDCATQALKRLYFAYADAPQAQEKDILPFALQDDEKESDGVMEW